MLRPSLVAQVFLDVLEFVFAQHAVVDEDAGELRCRWLCGRARRRPRNRRRRRGAQMTWPPPTLSRICATVVSMKWAGVQSPLAPQMLEDKVADKLAAEGGVVDFGMELDGPDAALCVGDSGEGIGGLRRCGGSRREAARPHRRGSSRPRGLWGMPANKGVAVSSMVTSAWPYSRLAPGRTLPPR